MKEKFNEIKKRLHWKSQRGPKNSEEWSIDYLSYPILYLVPAINSMQYSRNWLRLHHHLSRIKSLQPITYVLMPRLCEELKLSHFNSWGLFLLFWIISALYFYNSKQRRLKVKWMVNTKPKLPFQEIYWFSWEVMRRIHVGAHYT